MKKLALFLCFCIAVSMACNSISTPEPATDSSIATVVAATLEALTPADEQVPIFSGTQITYNNVSLVIPPGVATGADGATIPPRGENDAPPWDISPGHMELKLTGYALHGTFHDPILLIYPAPDYAALQPGAAENILYLQTVLANPTSPLNSDGLPHIPFFNAAEIFAAKTNTVQFQAGAGVRGLNMYGQAVGAVTNHNVFYHFEGLTFDGQAYIIAILPISAPVLAEDDESPNPPDGVPFPGYTDPNADYEEYYNSITEKLNSLPPDAFHPSLTSLDTLIGSMQITPQR